MSFQTGRVCPFFNMITKDYSGVWKWSEGFRENEAGAEDRLVKNNLI